MARWRFRRLRTEPHRWWPVLAALALAGCGEGPAERLLTGYQGELAKRLALPPPAPETPANIGAFPERGQRLFEIPETREGLLDVFALRGCHIANLVAKRNNQLGRVAAPSQRWLYELRLWRRLSGCWNREVPDTLGEGDRQRLARLTRRKTDQLPRASWNALFASSEWTGSFSRASAPLPPGELDAVDAQLPALAYLREATLHQFDRRWSPDSATLEGHLKRLRDRPLTAELLRALMLAERRVTEASGLLETALEESRCPADGAELGQGPQARRLAAWLPRLQAASRRWLAAVAALLDAQAVTPRPAVADYRRRWLSLTRAEAPWPALAAARTRHHALLASLRRHCR